MKVIPENNFKIINNYHNEYAVDFLGDATNIKDGAELILFKAHNGLKQIFTYDKKTHQIINVTTRKAIDIVNGAVVLNTLNDTPMQKWLYDKEKRIQSELTKQYLTVDEQIPDKLYLMHDVNSNIQRWTFEPVILNLEKNNKIKKKEINDLTKNINKLKNINSSMDKRTIKYPEKPTVQVIEPENQPPIHTDFTIQVWIKIYKFNKTELFKPFYYLNPQLGLWLYPTIFKLFVNKDVDIPSSKLVLNDWFNITQVYTKDTMKLYFNAELVKSVAHTAIREPSDVLTIINDSNHRCGTFYFSNYAVSEAKITERYVNSIYNSKNNPYLEELNIVKKQLAELQRQYTVLKHTQCPPAEKCIPPINVDKSKVIKLEVENKKLKDLVGSLQMQSVKSKENYSKLLAENANIKSMNDNFTKAYQKNLSNCTTELNKIKNELNKNSREISRELARDGGIISRDGGIIARDGGIISRDNKIISEDAILLQKEKVKNAQDLMVLKNYLTQITDKYNDLQSKYFNLLEEYKLCNSSYYDN